jgi:hypothetical protein
VKEYQSIKILFSTSFKNQDPPSKTNLPPVTISTLSLNPPDSTQIEKSEMRAFSKVEILMFFGK